MGDPPSLGALHASATLPLPAVADVRDGPPGAAASDVTIDRFNGFETGLTLPAASVAFAATACAPGASAGSLYFHPPLPSAAVVPAWTPSLRTVTVRTSATAVPATVGAVRLVVPSPIGGESEVASSAGVLGAGGAVPSIVIVIVFENGLLLPAESNAAALIVYVPSASGVVVTDQLP